MIKPMRTRSYIAALTIILLGLSGTASAAAQHLVSTEPLAPAPDQAFLIEIQGTWPNGCPFSISPVTRVGQALRVQLTQQGAACTEALRPYRISIDPAPSLPEGLEAGAYQLYVEADDGSGIRTVAFSAFSVQPAAKVVSPEPGFWVADASGDYADSGSGVGFNLERQDDAIALIAYFYDSGGDPRWYFSAGDTRRTHYSGDLLEIRGGQTVFQPYQAPRDMRSFGRIDLSFIDRGHAVAWFSQPEDASILAALRIMPISLVRFGFNAGTSIAALSGPWMLVNLDKDGGSGSLVDLQPGAAVQPLEISLMDERNDVHLNCGVVVEHNDQPPALCVLRSSAGSVSLENNGINELRSADGNTRLMRISP